MSAPHKALPKEGRKIEDVIFPPLWINSDRMADNDGFVDLRDLRRNAAGRHLLIALTVFLLLDFLFIGIRFYARKIKKRYLEINDWAILVGFVSVCNLASWRFLTVHGLFSSPSMSSWSSR